MASTPGESLYRGMRLVRPLLRRITARVERDLRGTGISVGQRAILEALHEAGEATAPMLTQWLDMKRQFVSRELKVLLDEGRVALAPNPDHARSPFYRLTPESAATIGAIRDREMRSFEIFAARFTPEDLAAFVSIMEDLHRHMPDDGEGDA